RFRLVLEQRRHRHDHPALAIAALRNVVIEPGLLHLVQRAVLRQPFDRGDLPAGDRAQRHRARAHRNAVDMDGAGAALGDAAAVLGAGQPDRVAQHPQQRRVGVDIDLMGLSIHVEISHVQTSLHRRPAEAMIDAALTPRSCRRRGSGRTAWFNSNMEIATPRGRIGHEWVTAGQPAPRPIRSIGALFLKLKRRPLAAASFPYANEMLWFLSGNERMRLPVAAKYALSTAGA